MEVLCLRVLEPTSERFTLGAVAGSMLYLTSFCAPTCGALLGVDLKKNVGPEVRLSFMLLSAQEVREKRNAPSGPASSHSILAALSLHHLCARYSLPLVGQEAALRGCHLISSRPIHGEGGYCQAKGTPSTSEMLKTLASRLLGARQRRSEPALGAPFQDWRSLCGLGMHSWKPVAVLRAQECLHNPKQSGCDTLSKMRSRLALQQLQLWCTRSGY